MQLVASLVGEVAPVEPGTVGVYRPCLPSLRDLRRDLGVEVDACGVADGDGTHDVGCAGL